MFFLSSLYAFKDISFDLFKNKLTPILNNNWVYFLIIGLSIISIFFILYSIKKCLSFKSSIVQSAKKKYNTNGQIINIKKHNLKKQKYVLVSYEEYKKFKDYKRQQKNKNDKQSV